MRRTILWAVLLALAGVAGALVYNEAARDREYRRLIAQGDEALAADQTFLAIEAFSGAIALNPDSMLAHLRRGETYRRRGDLNSALRDLRAATRIDPAATRPLEQLGDVNYALDRYARAAESYQAYVRLDDHAPRLFYKLGLAHYRAGSTTAAIAALRQAVALDGRLAEAFYLLGLGLRDLHRTDEAVAALEQAVQLSGALAAPREELASLYKSERRDADAVRQLEALAALEPGRPERQIAVGLSYARAGRTDLALTTLGRAADQYPNQSAVYLALGRIWLEVAEARRDRVALNKALEALNRAAGGPPTSSEGLTLLGRALLLSGDPGGAERTLQQATAETPLDPTAFLYLANAAERLSRVGSARAALVRYVAIASDDKQVGTQALRIGDLSLKLGEPSEAAAWFRRAVETSGETTDLLERLADAQLRAGDEKAAQATLDKALQQAPGSARLLALRRRIR